MEDMRKGIYNNLMLFYLLNLLLLLLIVQEQLIIKLKKKEWECERTTMERVSLYFTVSISFSLYSPSLSLSPCLISLKDAHLLSSEKLKEQVQNNLRELSSLREKQLELEGRLARMTKQVSCSYHTQPIVLIITVDVSLMGQ